MAPTRHALDRELVFPTKTESGQKAQEQIIRELTDQGFSGDEIFAVKIALDEAIINAMRHGNGSDPAKQVRIGYTINDEHCIFEIEDEGSGFAEHGVPDPRLPENIERPSGRGLLLMRALMTECEFLPPGNCCRLRRIREAKS